MIARSGCARQPAAIRPDRDGVLYVGRIAVARPHEAFSMWYAGCGGRANAGSQRFVTARSRRSRFAACGPWREIMKKTVLGVAAAIVLLAVPALAKHNSAMDAKWMCRPAMSGEKPTAMMGSSGIVCKNMPAMTSSMGPKMTTGMTAAQMDAAWRAWLSEQMMIQSATGTTGGNG
jgi:hypothetical protein